MRRGGFSACLIATVIGFVVIPAGLVHSALITVMLIDKKGTVDLADDVDLGWDAIFDDKPQDDNPQGDQSSLELIVEGIEGATITLTKKVTFTQLDPIVITFRRVRPVGQTTDLEETFFMLKEEATNKTAFEWKGFKFEIEDKNNKPSTTEPDDTHPGKAHLHNRAWDANSGPFKVGDPLTGKGVYEMNLVLNPGQAPIDIGDKWVGEKLRMHDLTDPNPDDGNKLQAMHFTLKETPVPVPEPSTLISIVAIGGLSLIAYSRRRRKKTA